MAKPVDKYNLDKTPKMVKVNLDEMPDDLKSVDHWVNWKWKVKGLKWTKPPCTGSGIEISHLKSDRSYKDVVQAMKDNKDLGIGFSLRPDDKFCGIDFDDCINDKGVINKRAKKSLKLLQGTYVERSPSGAGLRVFGVGNPKNRGSSGAREIEIYKDGRYLTITGHKISDGSRLINIEKACKRIDKKIYAIEKVGVKKARKLAMHENADPVVVDLRQFTNVYQVEDRDDWVRFGAIIHYETGGSQEGFDFFNWWSLGTSANNYSEEDCVATWKSYKKKKYKQNPITIASAYFDAGKTHSSEWEDPISIEIQKVKTIKSEMMPGILWDMVQETARFSETPPELAFSIGLSVLATSLQKKISIETIPGHIEQLSIWTLAALKSGNRKSSVTEIMTYPLMSYEIKEAKKLEPIIEDARIQLKIEKQVIKGVESDMKKAESLNEKRLIGKQIMLLEKALTVVPSSPQIWAQDITTENLGTVMSEQKEKMGLFSAEGGQFQTMGGRYSNGIPNIDLYLQGFSGDSVRINRGSREPILLNRPAISMGISPQPSILKGLMASEGFRDRGFIARYIFFMPQSNLGKRKGNTKSIRNKTQIAYNKTVQSLLKIKDKEEPFILAFDEEGKKLFYDFSQKIEKGLGLWGKFNHITDWAGKLPGLIGRIAAIYFCVDKNPKKKIVPAEYLKMAISLSEVIIEHSMVAFDYMGGDLLLADARIVYRWIQKNNFEDFSFRECQKSLHNHFKTKDSLYPVFKILSDNYIIRKADSDYVPDGRTRATEFYFVNPYFIK